jgi:hypothetical protein
MSEPPFTFVDTDGDRIRIDRDVTSGGLTTITNDDEDERCSWVGFNSRTGAYRDSGGVGTVPEQLRAGLAAWLAREPIVNPAHTKQHEPEGYRHRLGGGLVDEAAAMEAKQQEAQAALSPEAGAVWFRVLQLAVVREGAEMGSPKKGELDVVRTVLPAASFDWNFPCVARVCSRKTI